MDNKKMMPTIREEPSKLSYPIKSNQEIVVTKKRNSSVPEVIVVVNNKYSNKPSNVVMVLLGIIITSIIVLFFINAKYAVIGVFILLVLFLIFLLGQMFSLQTVQYEKRKVVPILPQPHIIV